MSESPTSDIERHAAVRTAARAAAASVEHLAAEADESDHLHAGVAAALRESGLCELTVPAAHGGRFAKVDPVAITIVREELAAVSAHLDSLFALQGIGSYAMATAGSPAVQEQWLPRIASLDAIAALALTEPETGSDLRSISSRMTEDGDALVVDGVKAFITNAGAAAVYTVLVREGDDYSLVVVPADTPGVEVVDGPSIIAPHILGEVRLTAVRVPADHRVGDRGGGFALALATLAVFRVSVSGAAVGVATAALREAVRHAKAREQFGKPLLELGAVSQSLASCWVEIEAARSLTYRAAEAAADDPKGALRLSSMAKVKATETAGDVVDRCVQVMGRFGLVRGSTIERLYRNARPMRIYEGATEVILDSLARALAKETS